MESAKAMPISHMTGERMVSADAAVEPGSARLTGGVLTHGMWGAVDSALK